MLDVEHFHKRFGEYGLSSLVVDSLWVIILKIQADKVLSLGEMELLEIACEHINFFQ